jgi:hypothetical protein
LARVLLTVAIKAVIIAEVRRTFIAKSLGQSAFVQILEYRWLLIDPYAPSTLLSRGHADSDRVPRPESFDTSRPS